MHARAALVAIALAACKSAPTTSAGDAAPNAANAPIDAARPAPIVTAPPRPAPPDPCRAIGVTGRVTVGDGADAGALHLTAAIPPHAWIALEKDARLTSKDPRTGRELVFEGPARVQPCMTIDARTGDEEAWVAEGTFASTPGAGESPGQEQWVVTPLAVVRYSAAALKIAVTRGNDGARVTIRAGGGAAYVSALDLEAAGVPLGAPADAGASGWARLDVGKPLELRAKPVKGGIARERVASVLPWCGPKERGLPEDPGMKLSPADRAALLVELRQAVRAGCAIAALLLTEHLGPAEASAAWERGLAAPRGDSGAPMRLPASP